MTRLSATLKNFSQKCFFCDDDESKEDMHECLSIRLSDRVNGMAQDLRDLKIIGKLSEGDMVATEAKYHSKCLLSYFNKHRQHKSRTEESGEDCDFIQGM